MEEGAKAVLECPNCRGSVAARDALGPCEAVCPCCGAALVAKRWSVYLPHLAAFLGWFGAGYALESSGVGGIVGFLIQLGVFTLVYSISYPLAIRFEPKPPASLLR